MSEALAYVQITLKREDISLGVDCCRNGNNNIYLTVRYISNNRKRVSRSTMEKKNCFISTYDIHDVWKDDCQSLYNDGSKKTLLPFKFKMRKI